jgi:glycosyltransferase involved in cell wall biosynthesis
MTGPLVSAITPTYDGADFVAETIESVLAQTYERVEHVLVDDGSTDATPGLLARYAARHPERIRVVQGVGRNGPCRRRNEALTLARGELIAWLDHDDVWLPQKLERQVSALAASPAASLAYTQFETFDDGGTIEASSLSNDGDLLTRLFVEGCFIASSSVVFRRDAMARRRPLLRDDEFSFGDDHYLGLTLALDGDAVLVDDPLVRLRRHSRNESARLTADNFHVKRIRLLQDFLDEFPEARRRLGSAERSGLAGHRIAAAAYELERGRRGRAALHAARAARSAPRGAFAVARGLARRPRSRQTTTIPMP